MRTITITIIIRKESKSGTYDLYYSGNYSGWSWPENVPMQLRKDLTHALTPEEAEGVARYDSHQAL